MFNVDPQITRQPSSYITFNYDPILELGVFRIGFNIYDILLLLTYTNFFIKKNLYRMWFRIINNNIISDETKHNMADTNMWRTDRIDTSLIGLLCSYWTQWGSLIGEWIESWNITVNRRAYREKPSRLKPVRTQRGKGLSSFLMHCSLCFVHITCLSFPYVCFGSKLSFLKASPKLCAILSTLPEAPLATLSAFWHFPNRQRGIYIKS